MSCAELLGNTQTLKGNRAEFQSLQNGLESVRQSIVSELIIIAANVIKPFVHVRHHFTHTMSDHIQSSLQPCKMGTILCPHFTGEKTKVKRG